MTGPELRGHLRALNERRRERVEGVMTAPESWEGGRQDPFFAAHFHRPAGGRRRGR